MTRDGFTLVELMIVVAIIGVLASIAVPQYSKFQAKSRQTEVKIQLGAVYTVEQSFASENTTYSMCLGQIGYNRDGSKFYYTIGFNDSANSSKCGPAATASSCYYSQWSFDSATSKYTAVESSKCADANLTNYFAANIAEPGLLGVTKPDDLAGSVVENEKFTVVGAGTILSKADNKDIWTIDNSKQILNSKSGLN